MPWRLRHRDVMSLASSAVERLRLVAISLGLTVMIFAQEAGRTATNAQAGSGGRSPGTVPQPCGLDVGPLRGGRPATRTRHTATSSRWGRSSPSPRWLGVSPWATQRLWESALLVVAFLGMYQVARALGVAKFWPAVAAGLAYTLTRASSEITSNSAELLPSMVLPFGAAR